MYLRGDLLRILFLLGAVLAIPMNDDRGAQVAQCYRAPSSVPALLAGPLCALNEPGLQLPTPDDYPADWIDRVQQVIRASEYHLSPQGSGSVLQSPNRKQDLRITYHPEGFRLTPRLDAGAWHADLRVVSVGKDGERSVPLFRPSIHVEGNRAVVDHGAFTIQYTNEESGMRQDFHVKRKPDGTGPLTVKIRYNGSLLPTLKGEDDLLFTAYDSATASHTACVWYRDLKVWDAERRELDAHMELHEDILALVVDDTYGEYPLTIDPLSTTANWNVSSGQLEAQLGFDVGTAGDVNHDGYSDVIVGANLYDGASTNQGRALVYHGSATGLSTTPSWTRNGQAGSNFGISVSTAGDINGDGYSDVVVGAPGYTNTVADEGAALVYFGSATGLGNTPMIFASGEAGSDFGFSVATAGDVNGNDVSDLIVGAPLDNGPLGIDQGRVFLYNGNAGPALLNTVADWTMHGAEAQNHFGFNVSSAGDVNNDGYSDIIIGEPHYSEAGQVWEGRAVAFLGSAAGISGATLAGAAWTAESDVDGSDFGNCVAWAGDVNGDGYGDVIVSGYSYGNGTTGLLNQGVARIYYGNATDINNAFAWETVGPAAQAAYGVYVDGAGDVNGDGYADVIVGADRYDIFRRGSVHVYQGSAGGVSTTPVWSQTGSSTFELYGWCVGTAGDVNGDGYSDIIVGAPWAENISAPADEGRAFVFHGSPSGLVSSGTIDQTQASAFLGTCVSTAGDVNGDGYSDVIIGAPQYDNGQNNEGRAYIYHGGSGGLSFTANAVIENNIASSLLGTSVSTAGDVNGDGYSDVVIGAPGAANGQSGEGLAYVYYGSTTGLGTTPLTIERNLPSAALGSSVATAGDVNGDGYSDVVIGANGYSVTLALEGAAYVHLGSATGLTAAPLFTFTQGQANARIGSCVAGVGDVTGDGYGDVLVGASGWTSAGITGRGRAFLLKGHPAGIFHEAAWVVEGSNNGSALGTSVAPAGDVNGDGYADLIIGEPGRPNGAVSGAGRALVFLGAGNTPSVAPAWTTVAATTNAQYGFSVSKAGDVNKDGYGDIVVGAPGSGNGQVFVYHGSPAGLPATASSTFSTGNSLARMGTSVSNSGSQSGDGYGDVIAGAPEYSSVFPISADRGRVHVFTGNGGATRTQRTRQYRTDQVTPVQTNNSTFDASCGWTIGQVARSHLGRRKMKLVWETVPHGPAFLGTPITNSVAYTAQEIPWTAVNVAAGVEIKEPIISPGTAFPKWRVRLRHHPATMIDGQRFGPWIYMGIHDDQDPAIKVEQPDCGLLPVELLRFEVRCEANIRSLEWSTATEQNNMLFVIERSTDALTWETIGSLPGAGTSYSVLHYNFRDDAIIRAEKVFYRLLQVDTNGDEQQHPTRAVVPCSPTDGAKFLIAPNPARDRARVFTSTAEETSLYDLELLDTQGRIVRAFPAASISSTGFSLDLSGLEPASYMLRIRSHESGTPSILRIIIN